MILNSWRSDKLKTMMVGFWLLTVFFGFFGSTILLVKVPGLPALYPFRVLLPITAILYTVWTVREKRNPWKAASFTQRVCYILCVILAVYSTLSLFSAIDFEFTSTLWITLCFDLVYFYLGLELCTDRKLFRVTLQSALIAMFVHMAMGIREIFFGGYFTNLFFENFWFFGHHFNSPSVSAGNPNDYSMMLVFLLALFLLYWAWQGREEKVGWIPVALIAPVYFLIFASLGRLCTLAFWILVIAFALYCLTSKKKTYRVLLPAMVLLALTMAFATYGRNYKQLYVPEQKSVLLMEMNGEAIQPSAETLVLADSPRAQPVALEAYVAEPGRHRSSESIRMDMLIHTLDCFIDSRGMGVGLGNTAQLAKPSAESRDGVWAVHCFLARMGADFGIWFLIPLAVVAFKLLQFGVEFTWQELKKRNWENAMTGVLYLSTILVYPIASTAAGDAQNSLAMWLFLCGIVLFPVHVRETAQM